MKIIISTFDEKSYSCKDKHIEIKTLYKSCKEDFTERLKRLIYTVCVIRETNNCHCMSFTSLEEAEKYRKIHADKKVFSTIMSYIYDKAEDAI